MNAPLSLPTLLSQALVAFTIEVDSEFEHQMPHRTTWGPAAGSTAGPWHVSLPMWANFLRYVDAAGVPLRDLEPYAQMTNLAGLERWGYITIAPAPTDSRPKPPRADLLVRPTRAGRKAQRVWQPLPAAIELRWRQRFGASEIDRLRKSLQTLRKQLDVGLPRYLPVVTHRLFTHIPDLSAGPPGGIDDSTSSCDLSALLSAALVTFTRDVEQDSPLSLPASANLLRVLDAAPVRIRDLPRLSGVSKQSIAMSIGILETGGHARLEPDPAANRGKVIRLTDNGVAAREDGRRRVDQVEADWLIRFGKARVGQLRAALEPLVGDPTNSRLLAGFMPRPDSWRAAVPRPDTLPHHPMVLHRGGFPDGS